MRDGITLYFARHGETDWNRALRYQGQHDVPLNETGRQQARRNGAALRQVLANAGTLAYVASPLSRARETMEIIRSEVGLSPSGYATDDRLLELNYGVWQGQLAADVTRLDPAGVAWRQRDPMNWRADGGETYAELSARVEDWLATVTGDTVVVAHGGTSRVLRGMLLALDPNAVPTLEVPHDRVMVLTRGRLDWV